MKASRFSTNVRTFAVALATAGAVALATPAAAVPLQFSFTGDLVGSFIVDSNPAPFSTTPTSFSVHMWGVTGDFSGETFNEFFDSSDGGGFLTGPHGTIEAYGPQMFSGTLANPVFAPGKFVVEDFTGTLSSSVSVNVAPGAPGPEVGAGWLAAAAALAALAITRLRHRAVAA